MRNVQKTNDKDREKGKININFAVTFIYVGSSLTAKDEDENIK